MPKNREVLMDEEKRSNQNYEIIESCTIGSTELVIGHNPNAPNPYVCWYCKGGSNYFWGYYLSLIHIYPKLHVGICGEHGGDPSSVEFCHKIGLDYVSCSPFRVPIARLAAAQAAIANR